MTVKVIVDGLRDLWCDWTHGGGMIMRDPSGRINWQCNKCGRWSVPVPLEDESAHASVAIAEWAFRTESAKMRKRREK